MKFYLEQIIQAGEETKALSEYTSQDEAERAFHKLLADNISGEDVDFVRGKVINEHGGQIMCEYWQVPAPAPDPEDPEPAPVEDDTLYYFSQIRYKTDGTTLRSITSFETDDAALVAYHNLLYSIMADQQYAGAMVMVEDKRGTELHRRYWERS